MGLILMIAVAIACTGISVRNDNRALFAQKHQQLGAVDVLVAVPERLHEQETLQALQSDDRVEAAEETSALYLADPEYTYAGHALTMETLVFAVDRLQSVFPLIFVGDTLPPSDTSVYLPYMFSAGGQYRLGDDFVLTLGSKEYPFTVSGFVEDFLLGCLPLGKTGLYMPNGAYDALKEYAQGNAMEATVFAATLQDGVNDEALSAEWLEAYRGFFAVTCSRVVDTRSQATDGIAMILVAFAVVLALVALVQTYFRVVSSLHAEIVSIGALKAIGYTSRQIITAFWLPYAGTALWSSLLGGGLYTLGLPWLSSMYTMQMGLVWRQPFLWRAPLFALVACIVLVTLAVLFAARRIRTMHPVAALRKERADEQSPHEVLPLYRTPGSLQTLLAMQSMLRNKGQSMMTMLLMSLLCFSAVFALVIFYNGTIKPERFVSMMVNETNDLTVVLKPGADPDSLMDGLCASPGVQSVQRYDVRYTVMQKQSIPLFVMDDFSGHKKKVVYQGRYPLTADEVMITQVVADAFEKAIGESMVITYEGHEERYTVIGLFETVYDMGRGIGLTGDGMSRLVDAPYVFECLYVYLAPQEDSAAHKASIRQKYADYVSAVYDAHGMIESWTGTFVQVIAALSLVILGFIFFTVALILYLVIRTFLQQKQHDIGVQLAIGYSVGQIVWQITCQFGLVTAVGCTLGAFVGCHGVNPFLRLFFRQVGIMRVDLYVSGWQIALLCLCLVLFSIAVCAMVALQAKRITPRELFTE